MVFQIKIGIIRFIGLSNTQETGNSYKKINYKKLKMKMPNLKDILKPVLIPLHPEGWGFVLIFALVTIVLAIFWKPFWAIGGVLTLWCAYFFRDPKRVTPTQSGLVISPADGVIQSITQAVPPSELEMGNQPMTRIAVFMNVFDVHVNRSPMAATILKMAYREGKFLNADLDKASEDNERQSYRLSVDKDIEIAIVQIAGLVARRILTEVEEGDRLEAGQRIGMIRFGSRVDVYLPTQVPALVCEGQRAVAGETVLAEISALTPKGRRTQRKGIKT